MGVLTDIHAMTWDEIVAVRNVYQSYAVSQLIRIFEKYKDRQGDCFMWGDELEFSLVRFDHTNERVQLLLKAHQLLPRLKEKNKTIAKGTHRITWHPELCDYMIEGVPSKPYGCICSYVNTVEANMALRRKQVQEILSEVSDCEYLLNISEFPQHSHGQFTYPSLQSDSRQSDNQSISYNDKLISSIYFRGKSLVENVPHRRQSPILVSIPIFRDIKTPSPFLDTSFFGKAGIREDHIHFDSFLNSWGCCCIQETFQAQSLTECLHLYDQLLPLTGIMLALSSACPIWRGYLADIDCRYNVLSQAADDRTPEERLRSTLNSRCSSTPFYLCDEHNHLNDVDFDLNEDVMSTLIDHGMPLTLSRYFGHLFIRDPLVIVKEYLHPKDDLSTYHFENLNATVWYSLRLKPPPLDDDRMGWRVEFRPLDIQITDFENASLVVFMALLTRAILTYNIDLTIPISQVNENMDRAHHRDSVRQEKFYFRIDDEIKLISIDDIINGVDHFPGLVPLVRQYLNEYEQINIDTRHTVEQYLSLISKRAAGILLTDASWMREFVLSHPDYKQDSVVSDKIQYDLLWKMAQIANGHECCPLIIENQMKTHTCLSPE